MSKKLRSPGGPVPSSQAPLSILGAILVAVLSIAYYGISQQRAEKGSWAARHSTPPSPSPSSAPGPLAFFGTGALRGFSAAHNASLLWGTYRPGVYFGLRSLTAPTGLAAGLMWSSGAGGAMRHKCEQDEVDRYGFSAHDGRGFGIQPIVDAANGIALTTSFLATQDGGWAVRIEGKPSDGKKGQRQSVFFYLGVDGDAAGGGSLHRAKPLSFQGDGAAHASGSVDGVGRFSVLAEAKEVDGDKAAQVHMWGTKSHDHLKVDELVKEQLRPPPQQGNRARQTAASSAPQTLSGAVDPHSKLLVLQILATPPFVMDVTLLAGGCDEENGAACKATYSAHSTTALTTLLESRQADFRLRLSSQLLSSTKGLTLRGKPLDQSTHDFAASALSALLGSTGFFYGSSKVAPAAASGAGGGQTPPSSLLAVVPSRPFFPRGFLWDEGFHNLVVGAWDPALADHILSSWLSLMHSDGWIPREQILGAEALARVPSEFVAQHRQHANPPALLLRVQRLLDDESHPESAGEAVFGSSIFESSWMPKSVSVYDSDGEGSSSASSQQPRWLPLLRELWPHLVKWHKWFVRTQAGEQPHTFRWRGRDRNDQRLNAMTLSSGLDDYPRATTPSASERHVDLHCWMAFFTRLLAQLGERLGKSDEAAAYRSQLDALLVSLVTNHWSESHKAFCDYGHHANDGVFSRLYVVKCATNDGSAQIEHGVENPQRPSCPRTHPRFMFPLGDGQGGLLTRPKFMPRNAKQQHVAHLGYVSLFPLMLKLLPPDSPQLSHILELIRDPDKLWSDYGLRSLSKSDLWYGKQNNEGDAPYWRGPIWINLNYLTLGGLKHYASVAGPQQGRAKEIYDELRDNLVGNMRDEWQRTGYFWEQYDPDTGDGKRTHPFNGWSSLALLALAEIY